MDPSGKTLWFWNMGSETNGDKAIDMDVNSVVNIYVLADMNSYIGGRGMFCLANPIPSGLTRPVAITHDTLEQNDATWQNITPFKAMNQNGKPLSRVAGRVQQKG
jgi:hypothetical protein